MSLLLSLNLNEVARDKKFPFKDNLHLMDMTMVALAVVLERSADGTG